MDKLAGSAVLLDLDAATLPQFAAGYAMIDWTRATEVSLRSFWQRLHADPSAPRTALVLTGGETAAFVLRALGATALRLCGEVERGIPWSRVEGGLAAGTLLITKSGGFGTPQSLVACVEFSQRMKS
jgi:uncharacterized protein YgbK (DUF1537 family)